MCFSATVSFGASAVIGTIGLVAFKKSETKPQRFFSMIPLLFSVQQFCEGLIWVNLTSPEPTFPTPLLTYIFLFFAWIIWPIFIPFTMRLLEQNHTRKKILSLMLLIGTVVSAMLIYNLVLYDVTAKASQYHIVYERGSELRFYWLVQIFYLLSSTISLFISSVKRMRYLGAINLVSVVYSFLFFEGSVISVWCFFAAISSIMVLVILLGMQKKTDKTTTVVQHGNT
ncbi:MAG: DMSO reductase anchor subunit [Saprospiraceae bacterium]|jgi:DMSO reductase anchor subunit